VKISNGVYKFIYTDELNFISGPRYQNTAKV